MTDLIELHIKHGPTKYRDYIPYFEKHLSPIRHSATKVLEIGVHYGASLVMWRDYFPNAQVYGVDISNVMQLNDTSRITHLMGDQADVGFMSEVASKVGELDFVNDDGGHQNHQQQISFRALWPIVKSGGLYVIEDLGTSYRSSFLNRDFPTTAEFLYGLVDMMNHGADVPDRPTGTNPLSIRGIYFYEWMCVLEKA